MTLASVFYVPKINEFLNLNFCKLIPGSAFNLESDRVDICAKDRILYFISVYSKLCLSNKIPLSNEYCTVLIFICAEKSEFCEIKSRSRQILLLYQCFLSNKENQI
jgi:hypothetical protein